MLIHDSLLMFILRSMYKHYYFMILLVMLVMLLLSYHYLKLLYNLHNPMPLVVCLVSQNLLHLIISL